MAKCGAKAKSTGKPCQRTAMLNGRCYVHGGAQKRGITHPNIKHGRYSKDLPTRMMATYEASVTDPELLNLTSEISVTDARLNDLIKRVDSGESGLLWAQLKQAYTELQAAQRERDTVAVAQLLGEIGRLITRGHGDSAAWREIGATMEQRRKLVESERKRRTEMQSMITAERATLLFKALTDSIVRRVEDADIRAAILDDFRTLVDR